MTKQTKPHRELVETIARIIEPTAFQYFDDLTPTEREMWNDKRKRLLSSAKAKARKIVRFITKS